jgi:hypothetical protein
MRLRESIVRYLTLVPRRLAYNRALELMPRSAGRPSLVIVGNSRFDFDCGTRIDGVRPLIVDFRLWRQRLGAQPVHGSRQIQQLAA